MSTGATKKSLYSKSEDFMKPLLSKVMLIFVGLWLFSVHAVIAHARAPTGCAFDIILQAWRVLNSVMASYSDKGVQHTSTQSTWYSARTTLTREVASLTSLSKAVVGAACYLMSTWNPLGNH